MEGIRICKNVDSVGIVMIWLGWSLVKFRLQFEWHLFPRMNSTKILVLIMVWCWSHFSLHMSLFLSLSYIYILAPLPPLSLSLPLSLHLSLSLSPSLLWFTSESVAVVNYIFGACQIFGSDPNFLVDDDRHWYFLSLWCNVLDGCNQNVTSLHECCQDYLKINSPDHQQP